MDAALLEKHVFAPNYTARVALLHDVYPDDEEMLSLASWAMDEKLRPSGRTMSAPMVVDLYSRTNAFFMTRMFRALSAWYGQPVHSTDDISNYLLRSPRRRLERAARALISRSHTPYRRCRIGLAQSYIAEAFNGGTTDKALLRKGSDLLSTWTSSRPGELDWESACLLATEIRMDV